MRHVLLPLFLACAAPVAADETGHGRELYLQHCAACHGTEADGKGPMSQLLTIAVPDLNQLQASSEDDVYPMSRVVQTIDGRIALRGHGGPMLVYGQILGGGSAVVDLDSGGVLQTRGDIVSIAEYLDSVQAK